MTSAARPTFLPAMGGFTSRDRNNNVQSSLVSSLDLPQHKTLKTRVSKSSTTNTVSEELDALKLRLKQAEAAYKQAKSASGRGTRRRNDAAVAVEGDASSIPTLNPSSSTGFTLSKQALERQQALAAAKANNEHDDDNNNDDDDDDDDSDSSNDSSSDNNSDSDDSDSDDDDDEEDDTEKLMAELEKIKRERAEERERLEREREEAEEEARLREAVTGNPLLAGDGSGAGGASSSSRDFSVKRRWDDDVIFKNQAKGVEERPKKRFINDLLRSDFHKKFMSKYIK